MPLTTDVFKYILSKLRTSMLWNIKLQNQISDEQTIARLKNLKSIQKTSWL